MKILIIKPSSFGDIIQALPCANALKQAYCGCEISWVVFNNWEPLLKICCDVDKIITWDREKGLKGFFEVLKKVKKIEYDIIVDLQGLLRSAALAKFAKAKIKLGVPGMKEFSNFLIKEVYPKKSCLNATLRNLEPVHFLTGKIFKPEVNIKINDDIEKNVKKILQDNGLYVDCHCEQSYNAVKNPKRINILPAKTLKYDKHQEASNKFSKDFITLLPFARGKGKDWSIPNYCKLIDIITKKYTSMHIVILGLKCDFGKIRSSKVVDLCGKTTIEELAGVLLKSKVAVGADTGSMHLAAVLQTPSVFVFGSSDINETSPYIGHFSLIENYSNPDNINDIKPESVFAEIEKWIK
ncbi:lipopolysaccharide heptosyltransferase I [Endomicrobiia bacterium]|nr:lipopolysaccharide heptosyltransferase I [Endomicrobiia bacterium]GHT65435.1 lipopolysaccharide heptosyltransferase I [Endomicrobiia bacterium]GHT74813.1 lipopolysaccharide heptosyltransferase I [Endomicrobiia bacterium]